VDSTSQALNYFREFREPPVSFLLGGDLTNGAELDKEELWDKARLGYPLTEKEIASM
jgi:hypothetical protein